MQDSNLHYRLRTPAFSSIKLIEQIGAHGLDLNRHHLPYKGSALPLSDVSIFLKFEVVDVNGIEPLYPVCKTGALPLSYTSINLVRVLGFEPRASCSQSKRSSQTELHPERKFLIDEK